MKFRHRLVARLFHRLYVNSWRFGDAHSPSPATLSLHWFGHEMIKCPMDLWVYQEILVERRPDWVIEAGTFRGGTSLYVASILDLIGHGEVITIDPHDYEGRPVHPRIRYWRGSSTAPETIAEVKRLIKPDESAIVILDSDHSAAHVADELRLYRDFVGIGDFLIVEDTHVNGHPVFEDFGPGPMEAVRQFVLEDKRFISDPERERFLLTMNPQGYLRRVS